MSDRSTQILFHLSSPSNKITFVLEMFFKNVVKREIKGRVKLSALIKSV